MQTTHFLEVDPCGKGCWLHVVTVYEDRPPRCTTLFPDTGRVNYRDGRVDEFSLEDLGEPIDAEEFKDRAMLFTKKQFENWGLSVVATSRSSHATREFVGTFDRLFERIGKRNATQRAKEGLLFVRSIARVLQLPLVVMFNDEHVDERLKLPTGAEVPFYG